MTRKIVLLADGTGNGRLVQVSNICRLSQALDMSNKDQLVYYIPGVGTETFKPLALLDGATGFGVPANVRKLYRFLSWNWTPDAAIYMFGFSRGAFTIRMLVDLIAKQGLLPTEVNGRRVSHQEMIRNSNDAWRAFCAKDPERRNNLWVALGLPKLRDKILSAWKSFRGQPSYAQVQAADPARAPEKLSVDFLGLFDTVEAYGVPIEEMREGVHLLVFPIKFGNDHTIWRNVRCVRHALSLDDERRTFHPIRVSLSPGETDTRIQEVWFSGVHSDVGGGYPDDMAAHVPLLWMIGELEKAAASAPARALGFHAGAIEDFKQTASAFGPLHDSRAGAAVLYRYDPRQVTAKDPKGNDYYRRTVHHSVVERLVDGYDEYAPLALGDDGAHNGGADVVMPDGTIARAQTGSDYAIVSGARADARYDSRELAMAKGAMKSLDAPDREEMEIARDYVWLNRGAYFLFVTLFLIVLALPLLDGAIDEFSSDLASGLSPLAVPFRWLMDALGPVGHHLSIFFSGLQNVIRGVGNTALSLTPSYLYAHVKAALNHPLFALGLGLFYMILQQVTEDYTDAIRYHGRRAWNIQNDRIKGRGEMTPALLSKIVRAIRTSPAAASVKGLGRVLLPGTYAVLFLIIPALVVANRIGFNYLVGSGRVCIDSTSTEWVTRAQKRFQVNDPCWSSGWALERGGAYRLAISVDLDTDDPWLDRLTLTDTYGFEGAGLAHGVGVLLRRWPSAAWFQPIARIGGRGDVEWPLAPIDGGGPLSPRGRRCSTLPRDYSVEEHNAFCANHQEAASCASRAFRLGTWEPLPRDEIAAAKVAWMRDRFPINNGQEVCNSPFPRKTFVSEFVAADAGELFLFVNDAAHVTLNGREQAFYSNNTGTATVALERLPRTQTQSAAAAP